MESKPATREEAVIRILEKGPATPDEVAQKIGIAWATAQGILMKLASDGTAVAVRKGKVNVYLLRFSASISPRTPRWAKAKNLEELSKELEPYFPRGKSAAEIIEKERRKD
jgi:transcription initiation factor IIE alpha subunit